MIFAINNVNLVSTDAKSPRVGAFVAKATNPQRQRPAAIPSNSHDQATG